MAPAGKARLAVTMCVGTGCHLHGSQQLLKTIMAFVATSGLRDEVEVKATSCLQRCADGPHVLIGSVDLQKPTVDGVIEEITRQLQPAAMAEHA
jgi:NADH:ubiquinone oxidoreductase subunit E